jgi:hypothetical protein
MDFSKLMFKDIRSKLIGSRVQICITFDDGFILFCVEMKLFQNEILLNVSLQLYSFLAI